MTKPNLAIKYKKNERLERRSNGYTTRLLGSISTTPYLEELLEVLIDSVVEDDDYIFFELVDTIPDDLRRLDSTMYERTKEDAQRLYEALSILY